MGAPLNCLAPVPPIHKSPTNRDNFSPARYNLSFYPVSQWNPLWLFISSAFPHFPFFLTPPPAPRPFRAPPSLPVYPFRLVSTILFLLGSSLTLTLTEGLCTEVALVTRSSLPLSPYLPSSLPFPSLEENHTLISLPALFLTSRLARRILMKLHSQLTPKAHNNLLCEQTHVHARVQTRRAARAQNT